MNALRVPFFFFRFEQKESTTKLVERGTTTQQHQKLGGKHPLLSTQEKTSRVTGQSSLQNLSMNDALQTPPKEVKAEEKKRTSDKLKRKREIEQSLGRKE